MPKVRSTRVLSLVIIELIRNAIKAIGRDHGKIRIFSTIRGGKVCLNVWNSGGAIPEQFRPYIFDFLYRPPEGSKGGKSRKRGMGFGLWWVRAVLRAQGGDISLLATPKDGTMFEISLLRGTDGRD
jgi:signal transduction histidine kinase